MALESTVREHLERGDAREAAAVALRALGPQVLGYLEAVLRDPDDARDAFQRFAEELWRWLPTYRGEGSLRAFAYRIAWHAAARLRREPWRRRKERMRTTMASRLAASIASGESRLRAARRDRLAELRAALEPGEQTLLILRLDREMSWDEVATVLSVQGDEVDAAAVRKRFERIKGKLARMAKAQGLIE
jgi:RNA polymerase sigma-70 factor (ECF subfamily)